MGTGTCAVLWQTKRNVVSAQWEDGKEGRGDLPFSSLSLESTDSGAVRLWSGLRFVSVGWQEKADSRLSQQQQNMFSTCVGRAGAGKASGAARVGYRESGSLSTFAQPAHVCTACPLLRRREREGQVGAKMLSLRPWKRIWPIQRNGLVPKDRLLFSKGPLPFSDHLHAPPVTPMLPRRSGLHENFCSDLR